jgi:hypothetical protein
MTNNYDAIKNLKMGSPLEFYSELQRKGIKGIKDSVRMLAEVREQAEQEEPSRALMIDAGITITLGTMYLDIMNESSPESSPGRIMKLFLTSCQLAPREGSKASMTIYPDVLEFFEYIVRSYNLVKLYPGKSDEEVERWNAEREIKIKALKKSTEYDWSEMINQRTNVAADVFRAIRQQQKMKVLHDKIKAQIKERERLREEREERKNRRQEQERRGENQQDRQQDRQQEHDQGDYKGDYRQEQPEPPSPIPKNNDKSAIATAAAAIKENNYSFEAIHTALIGPNIQSPTVKIEFWFNVFEEVVTDAKTRIRVLLQIHPDKHLGDSAADQAKAHMIYVQVGDKLMSMRFAKKAGGGRPGDASGGRPGLDASSGRLMKGFRYSGKRLANGRPEIVACRKPKSRGA